MATILVVDDRAANRDFLVTLLGYRGHRLLEAGDGAEALAMAKSNRPDLVIADILMPTMDGYEFVRHLRADADVANTAVVFWSASYHEHEAQNLARTCGVSHILTKPCEPEVVLNTIDQVLSHAPLQAPLLPPTADFDREHLRLLTDKLSREAVALETTNERLAALIDLSLQFASERDPTQLISKFCHAARTLIGARYAAVAVREGDKSKVRFLGTAGMEPRLAASLALESVDTGVVGRVATERRPLRLQEVTASPVTLGLPEHHPAVQTLLAVPVSSPTRNYGWICLTDKVGAEEFSDEDERLLTTLAAQAGRIYENSNLYAEVQEHLGRVHVEIAERKQAQEALGESEIRFRQLAENIDEVFFLIDAADGRVLYISPAYEDIWGASCTSLYADPSTWADAIHPDDRATVGERRARERVRGHFDQEYRIVRPSGAVRHIHARGFPIRDAQGKLLRTAGIAADITEHKLAEEKIRRLNRVYAVLSGINTLIVRVRDRQELFDEACRIAVEQGEFAIAWIGSIDPETMEVVPTAWAGLRAQEYIADMKSTAPPDSPKAYGVSGRAIRERRAAVINDLASAPGDTVIGRRSEAVRRGVHSVMSLPLTMEGNVVGNLNLLAREINFFNPEELKLLEELAGDISFALEHIAKEAKLNYLAYYDSLTGLPNRTLFRDRLSQALNLASQNKTKLAVVLCDIKRFRFINESFGRQAGDALLLMVAERMKGLCNDPDNLARITADTFAGFIDSVENEADVAHQIEKLAKGISLPFDVANTRLSIDFTTGVAVYPADGLDADTLFKNAEAALKQAKGAGEWYLFYQPAMNASVAETLLLENKLKQALEKHEFVLHYQPKFDLVKGTLSGLEALIRWDDPEKGLIPPELFIPLLEETGMILRVGGWVMRKALEDYLEWQQAGLDPPRIAVNVSLMQLRQKDFVDEVRATLTESTDAAIGLDLEITESLLMNDIESNIEKLRAIRDMGVSIAIDDFGTGYSSLSYLAKLPVNALKIDRSFVITMGSSPESMAIVSTILSLARTLNLKVIAEGVETEEQSRFLTLLRCDEVQGYLFGKPMPKARITELLTEARTRSK